MPTYFLIMFLTLLIFSYYVINTVGTYLNRDEQINLTTTANIIASLSIERNYISPDYQSVEPEFDTFLLQTLKIDQNTRVLIINDQAETIYDSFHDKSMLTKAQIKQSVMTALSGNEGFEIIKNKEDNTTTIDVSVPIIKSSRPDHPVGVVNISCTSDKNETFVSNLTKDMSLLFIAVTFIMGLFIFIVANFLTKRIVDFTGKITEMSDGILDEKLEIKGNDEVARLGEAFNLMSDKLSLLEQKRIDFVSNASHELRTPLSSIKLMCDSIMQNPDIDMEYVREFLHDMNTEVERLNRIIEKLLYLTKLDNVKGEAELNMEFIDIRSVVLDIVKNLMPLANAKKININCDYCETLYIMADNDKLWQGVYNIIDNAIKYTKENGQIVIGITKYEGNALIAIKDSGIGISQEEITKIFDRFYRVDKARSRETGGTGLGLSIAMESLEMIGGKISVVSEPGKGSTFSITLPLVQSA